MYLMRDGHLMSITSYNMKIKSIKNHEIVDINQFIFFFV